MTINRQNEINDTLRKRRIEVDGRFQDNYLCAFHVATDTEMDAQLSNFDWKELYTPDGLETYYETRIERDGIPYKLLLAQTKEQGMVAATALSFKFIFHFRPKYLIMTGIAAGTAYEKAELGEYQCGDVVVANMVWNYAKGKYTSAEKGRITHGAIGFIPRPSFLTLNEGIEQYVRRAAEDPDNSCRVHIGPMACGYSVIANKGIVKRQVIEQISETIALDMESYGVMYAAQNSSGYHTIPMVIKSICDFADERKDDTYQQIAAETSTRFAKLLIEKYLPV